EPHVPGEGTTRQDVEPHPQDPAVDVRQLGRRVSEQIVRRATARPQQRRETQGGDVAAQSQCGVNSGSNSDWAREWTSRRGWPGSRERTVIRTERRSATERAIRKERATDRRSWGSPREPAGWTGPAPGAASARPASGGSHRAEGWSGP